MIPALILAVKLLKPGSHVGVSALRALNSKRLAALESVMVIHAGPEPVSIIIPYRVFMAVQAQYLDAMEEIRRKSQKELS